ncbi:MAG TPA: LLM class flavin-dependent oxidoreductase [Acidimicrobiales bacterium]|nr:LLM class flavin-dependent oxidoreductase [Acidimicrobiales bacterium]
MKIGLLLPTFEVGARHALDVAAEAAESGLDGVFAYDHLWPMGSPARPALAPFPVLAAVAARHEICVGPLVARVGLFGTAHLVETFTALEEIAPGRVIAALGTGDKLSAAENAAYGLPEYSPRERREMLGASAATLAPMMPVWIGAGAPATNELARALGVTLNMWNATPADVAAAALEGAVCWAGPVPSDLDATLDALDAAGATWAVLSPHAHVADLARWRRTR